MPAIVGAQDLQTEERPFRAGTAATLVLGLVVAAVGAYAWLGPARITVGHRLELSDPRLGAEPFRLTIALDPRSGRSTMNGLPIPRPRAGETFPVPYGPDAGQVVRIEGVESSDGVVRIRTRCSRCRTVEWERPGGVLEIGSEGGAVTPGMGYELHVRAGAGPLEVEVRSPSAPTWRQTLGPLNAVALQDADCPSEEGPCAFGPGFAIGDDEVTVVRLRAREGSPGFEFSLLGRAHPNIAMRDRRSSVANAFFVSWLVLGLLVAGGSLLRTPSTRVRAAVLLALGLSVPVALWIPGSSGWYWWPIRPIPMGPLLAGSSVVVSAGAAWVLSRDIGLPWARVRRLAFAGTVCLAVALVLAFPALLIDERSDLFVEGPGGEGLGSWAAYVSLYLATGLGVAGGWLLGAAGRERARMPVDERRAMP
ncbi:MAG TPA: hypothetical protein VFT27_00505 [Actinomycetota bacterium]|nr:hypothetical protein [Actinomycetota bacterium]